MFAERLRKFERAIDEAFAMGGEVATALVALRLEQGLSATIGQPAFRSLSQANVALGEARGHAVDGHRYLDKLAPRIGIDATMYGDGRKDPSEAFTGA